MDKYNSAIEDTKKICSTLNKVLEKSKYIAGKNFTIADIAI